MNNLVRFIGDIKDVPKTYTHAMSQITKEQYVLENGEWLIYRRNGIVYKRITEPDFHANVKIINILPDNTQKGNL